MESAEQRIERMVRAGKISESDGERLATAIREQDERFVRGIRRFLERPWAMLAVVGFLQSAIVFLIPIPVVMLLEVLERGRIAAPWILDVLGSPARAFHANPLLGTAVVALTLSGLFAASRRWPRTTNCAGWSLAFAMGMLVVFVPFALMLPFMELLNKFFSR